MPGDVPDDGQSLALPPRDYSDIVKLQEENVLDQFLLNPTTAALETITGAFAGGGKGLLVSAGRIAQGLVKGQIYDALADEIRRLREAGKLPDNLGETKHGLHTWAELCRIIDADPPDADRLEALKAMFYGVNKVNTTDEEQITAYQLWQIAKELKSGPILILKALLRIDGNTGSVDEDTWIRQVARFSGMAEPQLVVLHLAQLRELRLATDPRSGTRPRAEITNLGRLIIQNIQTYKVDLQQAAAQKVKSK
jgi:hypothetical protein